MNRRNFFHRFWQGAAAAQVAAVASSTVFTPTTAARGTVAVPVVCPQCGRMPLPPDCYDHGTFIPPADRLGEIDVLCANERCQTRFRARFWVEA